MQMDGTLGRSNINLAQTVPRRATTSPLKPAREILMVCNNGPLSIASAEISAERVGLKAFGLSALPTQWVPAFVVVDGRYAADVDVPTLQKQIATCLLQLNMQRDRILVRSSGVGETMRYRGRLESAVSVSDEIASLIKTLISNLVDQNVGDVHWIVQELITSARKGHLSNERRLSLEKRDWVAEFEMQQELPSFTTRIAVRHWRDDRDVTDLNLHCASEFDAISQLKHVALWATQLKSRLHFEWVWSGKELRIVQVDLANLDTGVDPTSLGPPNIPQIALASLRLFKTADAEDFAKFSKLHNAKIYRELGYEMPIFFVLRDAKTIHEILRGKISTDLEHDLAELTRRPLIIRTDGSAIPVDKSQMLPRSDELRTLANAEEWIVSKFKPSIKSNGLEEAELCLIAHHFIPSVSAAWARAEPGKRVVRIESLWGLPEGLYWYSHDTFEVDTQDNSPENVNDFSVRKRLRYKGTFIAPDTNGRWLPFHTAPPYDWTRSIQRRAWVCEIASTTRRVAEQESHPVVVMWFIGNDSRATGHGVLPWFHSKSQLDVPKAAPRRKLAVAADFRIETELDWRELQRQIISGRRIERIVIEPKDPDLIRNPQFAEALAAFAAKHNLVVELAGGILSHAYYMLQRHGAQVECIDLFGSDEDVIEYNKLVRDKIPEVIEGGGEDVEVVELRGEALLAALRQKLVEESFEAFDAKSADELLGELADVTEVISGICKVLNVTASQLEEQRTKKAKRRGRFENGVMLKRTSMPRSLSVRDSPSLSVESSGSPTAIIEEPEEIPTSPSYRRADLRNVDQRPEKLLTFETALNKVGGTKESTSFSLPVEGDLQRFTVSVEITRNRSSLRGNVRVRAEGTQSGTFEDSQLKFDFHE